MKTSRVFFPILTLCLALSLLAACVWQPGFAPGSSSTLKTFSENDVAVSIDLRRARDGQFSIAATFTPLEAGYHLYSKDIPRNGVEGLGRPTLLELTANSKMKVAGDLAENIPAQPPHFEPRNLLVYPPGPVTLTLPITLPAGKGRVEDEISLTFMICNENGCRQPVIGEIVSLEIPAIESISN